MKPTTAPTNEDLKVAFNQTVGMLKTLRDEIRVDLHLAGMDAKTQWEKLEARFLEADPLGWEATAASKTALEGTVEAFKEFRRSLAEMRTRQKS